MRVRLPSLAALPLLLLSTSVAQAWPSAREAVERFVQFDLDGGRLQAWPFADYLAVPKDYDEPGWDEVSVVQSWRIGTVRCSDRRCDVDVAFTWLPTRTLGNAPVVAHPDGGTETIRFVATRDAGSWRLESSMGTPRVSAATFRRTQGR